MATHDKWQADTEKAVQNAMKGQPEAFKAADAIETRFGAKRTEAVMQEELRAAFSVYDARRKASSTKKAQAKEILVSSVGQAYTSDVLHTENRMGQYFSTAMNGGREKAEMALTDYAAGKKDALAEILSRAVQFAGDNAGTHPSMKSGGDDRYCTDEVSKALGKTFFYEILKAFEA